MTGDDNLGSIFPEPPPPAPKPRETAIAAALARFDGAPAPARKPRSEPAPWRNWLRRPQAGLIAMTALVMAISLPFALRTPMPLVPVAGEAMAPGTNDITTPGGQKRAVASAASPTATPPADEADAVGTSAQPPQLEYIAPNAELMDVSQAAPAAPPPAMRADERASIELPGRALSQLQKGVPVAASVASSQEVSEDREGSIVVTGTSTTSSKRVGRGDWNACTVNDPGRALTRCSKLASTAPKAVRKQAEIHLSVGLKQAWNGQLDKAISAFDAAIAVAPDFAAAYLNRGLVHDRQGNSEAAITDLNRAVRLSPRSARAYYNRSVLLRKYGDFERADADEQQAINIDPRYDAIRQ